MSEKKETQAQAAGNEAEQILNELLTNRSIRALTIVLDDKVKMLPRRGAAIESSSNGEYHVTEDFCTCPDFQYRKGMVCKHIRAFKIVKLLRQADEDSELAD